MGQGIKPATVPGLLLFIVGVTAVVTSGVAEQATAHQSRPLSTGIPPHPAHTPDPPQPPSALRHPTFPDSAGQDPTVDWARYTGDESPTGPARTRVARARSGASVRGGVSGRQGCPGPGRPGSGRVGTSSASPGEAPSCTRCEAVAPSGHLNSATALWASARGIAVGGMQLLPPFAGSTDSGRAMMHAFERRQQKMRPLQRGAAPAGGANGSAT